MLDTPDENPNENPAGESADSSPDTPDAAPAKKAAAKKSTTKKAPAKKAAAKKAPAKKAAATRTISISVGDADQPRLPGTASAGRGDAAPSAKKTAKKAAKKSTAKKATAKKAAAKESAPSDAEPTLTQPDDESATGQSEAASAPATVAPLFQAPDVAKARPVRKRTTTKMPAPVTDEPASEASETAQEPARGKADGRTDRQAKPQSADDAGEGSDDSSDEQSDDASEEQGNGRRRRRRGGRRRRKSGAGDDEQQDQDEAPGGGAGDGGGEGGGRSRQNNDKSSNKNNKGDSQDGNGRGESAKDDDGGEGGSASSRRRRRRRRAGEEGDGGGDDPENTVTRVRKVRSAEDEITALAGSTRLEAKKQRRREGREAGRRRAPIVSEAEFLARREAVDRVMVIRQREDLTQIAVLEDKVLVEHYVARESQTSLIGNVYLGKVQNVLPSMEAAFIDIGKGRNAVLYAGEVNWDALGAGNGPRKIEQVLKSGQSVLVQVSKDPIGHKGARLTSQISLPGRFLVYVPDGTTSGISRKLPDTERNRLKALLKEIVPDSAGVIVRTAAEGASEDELTLDVERLTARWSDIEAKVAKAGEKSSAPLLLYGEPDLTLKVVRDLFTEDFGKLVVSGDDAWDMVEDYVQHVAPDLEERLERYQGNDAFSAYRIDEQIAKALDRKVWLPSGGSLVIDRTEAMTVVDVNTGKFTGSGGNLEETVTKNNLEAAEEIVRQLRLRDIGGIIVVDFIDMVLESNRDLVLRRMVECLGRDRTRHQVAEVTSLGLVQMTRKRIGTGLLEAFSESCEHCQGRGLVIHHEPVEPKKQSDEDPRRGRRSGRGGRNRSEGDESHDDDRAPSSNSHGNGPSPKDFAAMAGKPASEKPADDQAADDQPADDQAAGDQAADDKPADDKPSGSRSTRRRRTPQKPAGEEQAEQTEHAEKPAAELSEQPVSEQEEEPAAQEQQAPPEKPGEPAAPTVVTTTRRRSARRPAGPPGAAADEATNATDAGIAGEGLEASVSAAPHVPVKKKGARKR